MTIDVVICTYNRPKKLEGLVNELASCTPPPNRIHVIDSSDERNLEITQHVLVSYHQSNHKNQPYQRYVGYRNSNADWIVFLDDDMEVVNKNVFRDISELVFANTNLVGIALHFTNKQSTSTLTTVPVSGLFRKVRKLKRFISWLSGYPSMPIGKFGLCGNRGKQPLNGGPTELMSGGAFAAKHVALYKNFNFQLFDLFEEKMGMGEDGILGYSLSKQGAVHFLSTLQFLHNDEAGSNYANILKQYAERVLYSRLYLSLEKIRLDGKSSLYGRLHYYWYAIWRILGYTLNYFKQRTIARQQMLLGSCMALRKSFGFTFTGSNNRGDYWNQEYERTQRNKPS